ncbi:MULTISPECIES: 30S ribosomal protein S6 [Nisaea]|jgi:small subunit ribosomal protein S6|uniref:30S ribosomal protein S6 n=1 Tax=Nisaea TaxID=390876 RepID=UPI0003FF360D|nr:MULTISPECIES: 30S ribosomal protein S6 [Nisaea]
MPLYESVFIARQDISSAQAEQLTTEFSEIITNMGGEIKNTEFWGLRSLSYKIKKNRKGHYVLLHMEAPAEAITEMERLMRLNEDVLRYITLRMEELPEGPSAIVLAKTERTDRGGRGGRPGGGGRFDRGDRPERSDRPDRGDRPERADREPASSEAQGD